MTKIWPKLFWKNDGLMKNGVRLKSFLSTREIGQCGRSIPSGWYRCEGRWYGTRWRCRLCQAQVQQHRLTITVAWGKGHGGRGELEQALWAFTGWLLGGLRNTEWCFVEKFWSYSYQQLAFKRNVFPSYRLERSGKSEHLL